MNEFNGMHLDDLITTFNTGIFRIVEIKQRFLTEQDIFRNGSAYLDKNPGDEIEPMFTYVKVATDKGALVNSKKIYGCAASFCKPVNEAIPKMIEDLELQIKLLKNFL